METIARHYEIVLGPKTFAINGTSYIVPPDMVAVVSCEGAQKWLPLGRYVSPQEASDAVAILSDDGNQALLQEVRTSTHADYRGRTLPWPSSDLAFRVAASVAGQLVIQHLQAELVRWNDWDDYRLNVLDSTTRRSVLAQNAVLTLVVWYFCTDPNEAAYALLGNAKRVAAHIYQFVRDAYDAACSLPE